MKKIALSLLLLAAISSCKKKYNCNCTTTFVFPGGQNIFSSKNSTMTEKMAEKQARAVCDHEAEDINKTSENYVTENGAYSANGQTFTTTCTLQ